MHVIDNLQIGGAERMLVTLVNAIDPSMYEPSVCVTRSGLALAQEIRSDIPVVELHRRFSFDPMGFIRLREYSQRQKVDLYHAHGRSTFQFLLTAKILGFINSPILLHDHFGDIEINQNIPAWFSLFGRQSIAYYVGVYEKLANWAIKAGLPKGRVTVIGNALDMKRVQSYPELDLHQNLKISDNQKIGIMIGNLRPAKGLDLLIKAYSKCHFDNPPIMVIVGDRIDNDYVESCIKQLKLQELEEKFIFVGQKSNVVSWMKGADFGVMPSRSESGPLVLIEMMGCGLPIVAFNVGNISEIASKSLPNSFAKPENTSELSKLLREISISSKEELIARGTFAKQIAYQMFDIEQKLPEWYSIYQKIIEQTA